MLRKLAVLLSLFFAGPQYLAAQPAPLAIGEHRFAVDGVGLWYRVAGRADGVPLVFLHGGPGQGSQAFQAIGGPELEKSHRLVYFDQRGAGRSDRPKDARFYSLSILADDVEALRRQLGVEKIAVLGHSFGTIVALEYAARYPDRAAAVVLAASAPDFPRLLGILCDRLAISDPQAHARALAAAIPDSPVKCNALAAYSGARMKQYVSANMFPDPALGDVIERLDHAGGLGNSGEQAGALFAQGLMTYRFAHPERISAPVLVIAGGRDFQTVIEPQRDLVRALPNGSLLEYRDNGHFMFAEDPRRFARDVATFVNKRR